jgi:tetratricopeptide (TPR) repeat protein
MYTLAMYVFELALNSICQNETIPFDPFLKARYYMQLGHCYCELKLYDKALENYNLTFDQNNSTIGNLENVIILKTLLRGPPPSENSIFRKNRKLSF